MIESVVDSYTEAVKPRIHYPGSIIVVTIYLKYNIFVKLTTFANQTFVNLLPSLSQYLSAGELIQKSAD